ncbi:MAG TPA: glutathione S-transferase family protein [Hyphomicrobiaceae bacterium]|nr:glutathione S-transferase family protein [Hyphomicrobiaceae bacterium]
MTSVTDPVPKFELVLYHAWASSASRKVRFALEEKGLAWTGVVVKLLENEQLTPDYLKLNPNGVVPTLVHHGRVVIESSVINEYLEDVFPDRALRPVDPLTRAHMRVWTQYVDTDVIKLFMVLNWNRMMGPTASRWSESQLGDKLARTPMPERAEAWRRVAREPFTEAERQRAVAGIRHCLDKMERDLGDGPWLAGDMFTLADIALSPYIVRIGETAELGLTLEGYPRVRDWWQRLTARPAFARARIEALKLG